MTFGTTPFAMPNRWQEVNLAVGRAGTPETAAVVADPEKDECRADVVWPAPNHRRTASAESGETADRQNQCRQTRRG